MALTRLYGSDPPRDDHRRPEDHRRPDHGHGEEAPITESVSCKHRPCAQVGVGGWAVPVGAWAPSIGQVKQTIRALAGTVALAGCLVARPITGLLVR